MITSALLSQSKEVDRNEAFYLQNSKLLKVELSHGDVKAQFGSMIAYQGDASFKKKGSGGIGKYIAKNLTGQGDDFIHVSGGGEVFFGAGNAEVQILYLENDAVVVNTANVLAFSTSLDEKLEVVKNVGGFMANGFFNTRLSGTGYIAILTAGYPFSFKIGKGEAPLFADPEAVVLWTPHVKTDWKIDRGGMGSMLRGGTGEEVQMAFSGEGIVVLQSSELITMTESASNRERR